MYLKYFSNILLLNRLAMDNYNISDHQYDYYVLPQPVFILKIV